MLPHGPLALLEPRKNQRWSSHGQGSHQPLGLIHVPKMSILDHGYSMAKTPNISWQTQNIPKCRTGNYMWFYSPWNIYIYIIGLYPKHIPPLSHYWMIAYPYIYIIIPYSYPMIVPLLLFWSRNSSLAGCNVHPFSSMIFPAKPPWLKPENCWRF